MNLCFHIISEFNSEVEGATKVSSKQCSPLIDVAVAPNELGTLEFRIVLDLISDSSSISLPLHLTRLQIEDSPAWDNVVRGSHAPDKKVVLCPRDRVEWSFQQVRKGAVSISLL